MSDSFDSPDGQTQFDPAAEEATRFAANLLPIGSEEDRPSSLIGVIKYLTEENKRLTERIAKLEAAHSLDLVDPDAPPFIGEPVLYVLPDGRNPGQHRRAFIMRLWGDNINNVVNLIVLTDGTNDFLEGQPGSTGILWKTSIHHSHHHAFGTWHRDPVQHRF